MKVQRAHVQVAVFRVIAAKFAVLVHDHGGDAAHILKCEKLVVATLGAAHSSLCLAVGADAALAGTEDWPCRRRTGSSGIRPDSRKDNEGALSCRGLDRAGHSHIG